MSKTLALQLIKFSADKNCLSECTISYRRIPSCTVNFQNHELGTHQFEGRDIFDCLCQLRVLLEEKGGNILCNGARIDAYPSPMSRDMGAGIKLYRLKLGKRPQRSDLLRIFDKAEPEQIGTVEEQRAYYEKWRASKKTDESF
ncbi:MAG: hypothetical protein SAL07_19015 [Oscillatoria sp. PMC 1051.18]|nr:hypothetical protein [Oscillatoria sp. PMC 1050.18]MEC5031994.1 hypothetical protein [Oscillatoria sp. PMC 1051.18]